MPALTTRGTPRLGPMERTHRQIAGWQSLGNERLLMDAEGGFLPKETIRELCPRLTDSTLKLLKDGLIARETVLELMKKPHTLKEIELEELFLRERGVVAELAAAVDKCSEMRMTHREIIALVKEIIGYRASARTRKGWAFRRRMAKVSRRLGWDRRREGK